MQTIIYYETFHYLDPATSSYIFQAIIAAGVTVGVFFKNIKFAIISVLMKYKKHSK